MRIRKRRPEGPGSGQQQADVAGGVVKNGVNPPNLASSHDLKIPRSFLFNSQTFRHDLPLDSSASGPSAASSKDENFCGVATSGRSSSRPGVSSVATRARIDVSVILQAATKCIGKSSSEELASVISAGDGVKLGFKDGICAGSAGCKKAVRMGRPSDPLPVEPKANHSVDSLGGHMKVLPLELILRCGPSASVLKSTKKRVANQGLVSCKHTQEHSSMSKLEEEVEQEKKKGGHNRPGKALKKEAPALTSPGSNHSKELAILERRKFKREPNTIVKDLVWLVKGGRRARSLIGRGQRSRMVGTDPVWAPLLGRLLGHPALETDASCNVKSGTKTADSISEQKVADGVGTNKGAKVKIVKMKTMTVKEKVSQGIAIDVVTSATSFNREMKKKTKKKSKIDQELHLVVAQESKLKKRKRTAEIEEQPAVVITERCKGKDGREWQCRDPVVTAGDSYCEHHTLKLRENHARSAVKLIKKALQMVPSRRKPRKAMDGLAGGLLVGEPDIHVAVASSSGVVDGQQVSRPPVQKKLALMRTRWRKKCKPCIRRLQEIQERAKPAVVAAAADDEQTEWEGKKSSLSASPSASLAKIHEPPGRHHGLPECLLNTDPRDWRADLL